MQHIYLYFIYILIFSYEVFFFPTLQFYGNIRNLAIRHLAALLKDTSHQTSTLKHILGGFTPLILCLEDRDGTVVSVSVSK